ncbi:MAG: glutamate--tRNA ligase [Patescibacteria group bacterium]
MNNAVRVRMAPSPTGYLHIGTARTALFNWLFARHHGGTFILRVEDTDKERSKKEFEDDIIRGFEWLGLTYDEFHRQSERASEHRILLEKLLDSKLAFYCAHTKEELEHESKEQMTHKQPPRHICAHRDNSQNTGILRLRNDTTEPIIVRDIIRGDVSFDPQLLGDISLAKGLDEPLYNFVVVADDAFMNITHVIRGEDHISNTPKQILIGRALSVPEPQWAHIPLLLGADRSKLSKRHGAVSVSEYRKDYLPEAFLNFIALLGWHPHDELGEILNREILIKEFSLERVQKGGAIVSTEKLDWFNKEYLRRLPLETFSHYAGPAPEGVGETQYNLLLEGTKNRVTRLGEISEMFHDTLVQTSYKKELLLWNGKLEEMAVRETIDSIYKILFNIEPVYFTPKDLTSSLEPLLEKHGKGAVLWPLRASLSGKEASLGPFELLSILGKTEALARLEHALSLF